MENMGGGTMKRYLILLILCCSLCLPCMAKELVLRLDSNRVMTEEGIALWDTLSPELQPILQGETLLVPLRFFAEQCGASVRWREEAEEITLVTTDAIVSLAIGNTEMKIENKGAIRTVTLPAPPQMIDDRTFIPLRSIAEEVFSLPVLWQDNGMVWVGNQYTALSAEERERIYPTLARTSLSPSDYPRIGSTEDTYPLAVESAGRRLLLSTDTAKSFVSFAEEEELFLSLLRNELDIILVTEPTEETATWAEQMGMPITAVPICADALVFVTGNNNPINSLTPRQLSYLFSGIYTSWQEVGGNDLPVLAYQQSKDSCAHRLLLSHVMKGTPVTEPMIDTVRDTDGTQMERISSYDPKENAIGYLHYHDQLPPESKYLAVNGFLPSRDNIQNRTYPYITYYYAVFLQRNEASPMIQETVSYLTGLEGQAFMEEMGYFRLPQ